MKRQANFLSLTALCVVGFVCSNSLLAMQERSEQERSEQERSDLTNPDLGPVLGVRSNAQMAEESARIAVLHSMMQQKSQSGIGGSKSAGSNSPGASKVMVRNRSFSGDFSPREADFAFGRDSKNSSRPTSALGARRQSSASISGVVLDPRKEEDIASVSSNSSTKSSLVASAVPGKAQLVASGKKTAKK